jgi:hypothetical protein
LHDVSNPLGEGCTGLGYREALAGPCVRALGLHFVLGVVLLSSLATHIRPILKRVNRPDALTIHAEKFEWTDIDAGNPNLVV